MGDSSEAVTRSKRAWYAAAAVLALLTAVGAFVVPSPSDREYSGYECPSLATGGWSDEGFACYTSHSLLRGYVVEWVVLAVVIAVVGLAKPKKWGRVVATVPLVLLLLASFSNAWQVLTSADVEKWLAAFDLALCGAVVAAGRTLWRRDSKAERQHQPSGA